MKLRLFAWVILMFVCGSLPAQSGVYNSVHAKVSFFSSAPLEDISAVNAAASSTINAATNEVTVNIPIKNFDFPDDLMEEHFNEDYLESNKFPAATFTGRINGPVDWKRLGKKEVTADGILNIHGVRQQRTITGSLIVGNNGVQLDSKFTIKLADHGIKIPRLVFQKIAEVIEVTCQFVYDNK